MFTMKELKVKYSKYDAGNIFLLSLIAPLMVMVVVLLVSPIFGVSTEFFTEMSVGYVVFSSLLTQGTFIGLFFVYNKLKNTKILYANNFRFKIGIKNYVLLTLITIISIYGMSYFLTIVDELFNILGYSQSTELPLPLNNFWWYLLSVLLLAVLPAIGEELLFRGVIYNGLKDYGQKIAIFGSALLFSLVHTSPVQTVYPFIFGLVLAYSVYKTNSLISSIFIHFLNNFLVVTFSFINITTGINLMPFINSNFWWIWCLIIGIVTAICIYFLMKLLKKQEIKSKIDIIQTQEEIKILNEDLSKPNKTLWYSVVLGVILWCIVLFSNF